MQGHNPGREEEEMVLTALICFFFIILLAYSPLFPSLCIFQLLLRSRGDPKN